VKAESSKVEKTGFILQLEIFELNTKVSWI